MFVGKKRYVAILKIYSYTYAYVCKIYAYTISKNLVELAFPFFGVKCFAYGF